MRVLLLLISLITVSSAVSSKAHLKKEWETFKLNYGKEYKTYDEEKLRFKIYLRNKSKINKHNYKCHQGLKSYYLGVNQYADWTDEEFKSFTSGPNLSEVFNRVPSVDREQSIDYPFPYSIQPLPKSIDWREKGAVTSVKSQGSCNSCYAFAAIGALEGNHFIKNNKLVNLSVQNVIDCSENYKNFGCTKGGVIRSWIYIIENRGVDTEEAYPYTESKGDCKFDMNKIGATIQNYANVERDDEIELMKAVATYGPTTAAVDFSHESIAFYHSGVYNEPDCDDRIVNHSVLIVGYGTDQNGTDYWLVKNTWGTDWGMGGYIHMSRNKGNQCGIASYASYLYPV